MAIFNGSANDIENQKNKVSKMAGDEASQIYPNCVAVKDYVDAVVKDNNLTKKYSLEYETIKLSNGLNSKPDNLVLVATKTIYSPPDEDGNVVKPECEGLLFFDSKGEKMYYSDSTAQDIKELCSWNKELATTVVFDSSIDKFQGKYVNTTTGYISPSGDEEDSNAKSAIIDIVQGATYKISTSKNSNRLKVYGLKESSGSLTSKIDVTFEDTDSFKEGTFTNTEGYDRLMVFLHYGSENIACSITQEKVSCFDYLATITADGDIIFFRNWLRDDPIIYPHDNYNNPKRIKGGLPNRECFSGTYDKWYVNNGVLSSNSYSHSVIIEVKSGAAYKITAKSTANGNFNRFRIYGSNSKESGVKPELIENRTPASSNPSEEYTFVNTSGYKYLIVFLDYRTTSGFDCECSIIETNLKPYGFLTSVSITQFEDGSFVFGEYTKHTQEAETKGDPRCIWRVTKPYYKENADGEYIGDEYWSPVKRFRHVYYENVKKDTPYSEENIGHIHTMSYDFYSDTLYCTTGDENVHCQVLKSKDRGATWEYVVAGDQKYRSLGLIFTKDACYYGTDSFNTHHALYKVERNDNGELDFYSIEKVCKLEPDGRKTDEDPDATQATYGTILLRSPNGLLFLDRAEPRKDNLLDIPFYSFDDEKLYMTATFGKALFNITEGRNGLCNQCFTEYQPTTTDFVLCGGGNIIRHNTTDILNNSVNNYIGVIKMKVVADTKVINK